MIDIISYLWSFTVSFQNGALFLKRSTPECQEAISLEATKLSWPSGSSRESALPGLPSEQHLRTAVGIREVKDPRKGRERDAWQFIQGTM